MTFFHTASNRYARIRLEDCVQGNAKEKVYDNVFFLSGFRVKGATRRALIENGEDESE